MKTRRMPDPLHRPRRTYIRSCMSLMMRWRVVTRSLWRHAGSAERFVAVCAPMDSRKFEAVAKPSCGAAAMTARRVRSCRMQYNQNAGGVEVQVFAKRLNTQPERVTVAIEPRRLRVEIRDEANAEAEYTLEEELYHEIDPAASSHKILGTQVLIKLRKVDGAVSWPSLGKSDVPVRAM